MRWVTLNPDPSYRASVIKTVALGNEGKIQNRLIEVDAQSQGHKWKTPHHKALFQAQDCLKSMSNYLQYLLAWTPCTLFKVHMKQRSSHLGSDPIPKLSKYAHENISESDIKNTSCPRISNRNTACGNSNIPRPWEEGWLILIFSAFGEVLHVSSRG